MLLGGVGIWIWSGVLIVALPRDARCCGWSGLPFLPLCLMGRWVGWFSLVESDVERVQDEVVPPTLITHPHHPLILLVVRGIGREVPFLLS